ncbi:hypothetical protein RvY_04069 [Ramazzottius varieornatus]|uniref:Uncharacterized protein n=1 Tax=Ramazzottius varieornatus TaxID=947166 RepID=A0A1D1UR17_RAMVA|nr:hypothetical protein RvY_04069 [Ramazzottius varieornatus]
MKSEAIGKYRPLHRLARAARQHILPTRSHLMVFPFQIPITYVKIVSLGLLLASTEQECKPDTVATHEKTKKHLKKFQNSKANCRLPPEWKLHCCRLELALPQTNSGGFADDVT